MTASTEVLVGDRDAEHVLIRVLSRNQPRLFESAEAADANWVDCEIEISAGGFRGAFRANLRSDDFQMFLDETEALNRALEGTATLSTMEEQIAVTLTADAGRIRADGEAMDAPGSDNRLGFSFEVDQTSLPEICGSLQVILAAFPVVGTADA